jgi:hypothetical protein
MIKIFCDCCGKEIQINFTDPFNYSKLSKIVFPSKRVSITPSSSLKFGGYNKDFLIELIVTAKIYEPENLLDELNPDRFLGYNICKDCIIETLTQKEK